MKVYLTQEAILLHRPRRALVASATALSAVISVMIGQDVADATTTVATVETTADPKPSPTESSTSEPTLVFPQPGGGPQAVIAFSNLGGTQTYVLNTLTGAYQELPYASVRVSPDGLTVAVEDVDGRIGVASRVALAGAGAVRWTTLPPGSPAGWSPDGQALLATTLNKDTRQFTAHRYDVATGYLRSTPINLPCDTCTAGWAADSTRYVVQLSGSDPDLPTGPMQYLNPDGTPGPLLGAEGHIWNAQAYSPSRRYAIVEPSRGAGFEGIDPAQLADWQLPRILDLSAGQVVANVRTSQAVLGWYDERQVVRVAYTGTEPTLLEVVDIQTGAVTKRVSAPGLPPAILQIGSSAGLKGDATKFGF